MKRQVLAILLLLAFAAGCANRAVIKQPAVPETVSEKIPETKTAFIVGERFTYVARWKGLPVGRATATIEELTVYNGCEVYKIVVIAETNKILSKLFPVKDTFISYVDKDKLISRRYEARRREGRYKKDVIVEYDFDKMVAIHNNLLDGTVKTCPITRNVQDPVSGAYFARTIPLGVGDMVKMTVTLNEENYEVYAKVAKRTKIKLPELGMFDAFLIKPYVKLKGENLKKGRAWGYVSADERRLGLYIILKVLAIPWVGEIQARLEKIEYQSFPASKI